MAGRDDRDKTVIGGPGIGRPSGQGAPRPAPGQPAPGRSDPFGRGPARSAGDKTVIGGALPTRGPASGAGIGGQPPRRDGDTWVGGALPPQPPAQPGGFAPPPSGGYAPPAASGGFGTGVGAGMRPGAGAGAGLGQRSGGPGDGFFPDMPSRDTPVQRAEAPRISLQQALQATGLGAGGSSNPLVAAAANLMILFGRLRTGLVEMQAQPLMEHVYHEIVGFEHNALAAGVPASEVEVAKYALCGTADDIVQNLPGADRGMWSEYSMAARFFNTRDTGVGFFHEAEKAMQAPGEYYNLLELMLTCLHLGFEGEYRTRPNGASELSRIRSAIHSALRLQKPRPDEDMSVAWAPVILRGKRRFGGLPVWAYGGLAAVIVVAKNPTT
ncbi:MAG: type IVB secretion system protein IcmH/DotU, partial [Pseudomonadota bacterium]